MKKHTKKTAQPSQVSQTQKIAQEAQRIMATNANDSIAQGKKSQELADEMLDIVLDGAQAAANASSRYCCDFSTLMGKAANPAVFLSQVFDCEKVKLEERFKQGMLQSADVASQIMNMQYNYWLELLNNSVWPCCTKGHKAVSKQLASQE